MVVSVTCTVKRYAEPFALYAGVPVIRPDDVDRDNPFGRLPDEIE